MIQDRKVTSSVNIEWNDLRIETVDLNTVFLYIFIFYNATVTFNHFACKFYNLKTYKAVAQCKRTIFQQTVKYNIFSSLNRDLGIR